MAAVRTTAYSERRRGALEVEAISPVMARLRFNLSRLQRESDAIQNLGNNVVDSPNCGILSSWTK